MSSPAAVASPGPVEARSRSWIDWILERVDSLGWPLWVFYPLLGIIEAVVVHVSKWSDGSLAFPTLSPVHLLLALWTAYPLGLIHALDRLADKALEVFRPALGENPQSLPPLRRALTTMPAGPVLLASLAGIGVLWVARFLTPQLFAPALTSAPAGALWMSLASLNFALVGSLIYHTLRQLKLVNDIYARTEKINLFLPEPLTQVYSVADQLAADTPLIQARPSALRITPSPMPAWWGVGTGRGRARFRWPIAASFSSTSCPSSRRACSRSCANLWRIAWSRSAGRAVRSRFRRTSCSWRP